MLIIFNPVAGGSRRRRFARALRCLRGAGARVEIAETRHAGHAAVLAAEAARRGERLIVAGGGDGTVAEVAGGMAGSGATLGLLPLGTANVLAHELGLPIGPEQAAGVLMTGREVVLRPGIARYPGGRQRLFVQMLGAGFDAAVVTHLNPAEKRRFGKGAYLAESLRQIGAYRFPTILAGLDDAPMQAVASVIVSKGRLYAGRFVALPGASPLHAGFSVLRFTRGGPLATMIAGSALPLGLLHRVPGAVLERAGRVHLASASPVPAQADGDAAGELPVVIEDAPEGLPFLVP
ncbi:diacylglycerol/lipid kinase family protein [Rhodovarius crocodyli]|uniref:diacylglycerol/lipid kinase family protein n=1 Tax=Rhodovarius crocodyli TaxID=1979269 RepID=UPI0013E3CD08|nr:diacylglycerol kinase family protein [Rhodovarius crocodyli]